jgi:hydroxymethylpyrimidine kinase/phosphomethylpyrimidine kinase
VTTQKKIPVALTIAGSDSGGGAGIQADLKTFAALGVHGASAIACLTAQNPKCVAVVQPVSPEFLRRQLEAVFAELPPRAVKTGLLFSGENVRAVARFLENLGPEMRKLKLVVDPVMVSTSGARLLEPDALNVLREELLPLATLVTPNRSEAEVLSGRKITSLADLAAAARQIHSQFGCAALVKGGHLPPATAFDRKAPSRPAVRRASDVFFDGQHERIFSARFVENRRTHGTGCVYSAAICAALARGKGLPQAIQLAKKFVTAAIAGSYPIGRHWALGVLSGH